MQLHNKIILLMVIALIKRITSIIKYSWTKWKVNSLIQRITQYFYPNERGEQQNHCYNGNLFNKRLFQRYYHNYFAQFALYVCTDTGWQFENFAPLISFFSIIILKFSVNRRFLYWGGTYPVVSSSRDLRPKGGALKH